MSVYVSVVMPVYNASQYVAQAIESILGQTHSDFEFIIVDDGSTDESASIIQSYDDPRIIFVQNQENLGIVKSLNKGLYLAKGKYIARMDADDISEPTRLQRQCAIMDKEVNLGLLATGVRTFGEGCEPRDTHSTLNPKQLKADLLFSCCVCHPSVMLRKSVLDEHGLRYNEDFKGAEDYELWWRLAEVSDMKAIPDILYNYRFHPAQVTQNYNDEIDGLLAKMLDVKLDTLGVDFSQLEKECFLKHGATGAHEFDSAKCEIFMNSLQKIIAANKRKRFFDDHYLRVVCALDLSYTLDNAQLTTPQRKALYKQAARIHIIPLAKGLKWSVRRILKV
jgi:glycosyltransferase involved in cell wall biosynthesis